MRHWRLAVAIVDVTMTIPANGVLARIILFILHCLALLQRKDRNTGRKYESSKRNGCTVTQFCWPGRTPHVRARRCLGSLTTFAPFDLIFDSTVPSHWLERRCGQQHRQRECLSMLTVRGFLPGVETLAKKSRAMNRQSAAREAYTCGAGQARSCPLHLAFEQELIRRRSHDPVWQLKS